MPAIWLFLALLLCFHGSEYGLAFVFQRDELSLSSTLLSREYVAAMSVAVLEHLLARRFLPALTASRLGQAVSSWGLVLAFAGEALRKAAILTARGNFTHQVRFERHEAHSLVRHGVYAWVRHPGYLGFFVWALGTQLLLCNPFCTATFAVVVWTFFRRRIPVEEAQLLQFFGKAYEDYRAEVPLGLPFIEQHC